VKEEGYTMVMDPQETGAATRKLRLPLVGDAPVMRAETDVDIDVEAELRAWEEAERERLGVAPSASSGWTRCSSRR
jgi:hypothetical protein